MNNNSDLDITKLIDNNIYDYIIVGAGCAGSVIAARLAEDINIRILLVDGGPDNSTCIDNKQLSLYEKNLITNPSNFIGTLTRYHIDPYTNTIKPSPSHLEYVTQKELTRYYTYPRGNGAGGSTNHHNMIDGRGSHRVYDKIAKLTGDCRWSSKNVLETYKSMESFNPINGPFNHEIHGTNGWLKVKESNYEGKFSDDFIKVTSEAQIPYVSDLNIPGSYAGVGHNDAQIDIRGCRSNAFTNLLMPMLPRNNLDIKFGCIVSRVLIGSSEIIKTKINLSSIYESNTTVKIEKNYNDQKADAKMIVDDLTAYGIEVIEQPYAYEIDTTGNYIINNKLVIPNKNVNKTNKYYARREVILCAGTFGTPQILMLSGIGAKEELEKIGIECIKNLPGVGKNLMDHHEFNMIYELDPSKFVWAWQAEKLSSKPNLKPELRQTFEAIYKLNKDKINELGCFQIMDWFSGLDDDIDPDLHFQLLNFLFFDFNLNFIKLEGDNLHIKQTANDRTIPNALDPTNPNGIPNMKDKLFNSQFDPENPKVYLSILIENMRLTENSAQGYVRLRDNNPLSQPIIELNLWKDELTLRRLAQAVLICRQLMSTSTMISYAKDTYDNFEVFPGTKSDTVEKIIDYLKTWSCIGHHAAGTAKIGVNGDPNAVVNSELKVFGTKHLRIVDASVYPVPYFHNYNPTRGIYMIAEMASKWIKSDYNSL